MKNLLFILFCLITIISCKKVETFDLGNSFPESIGNWTWDRTEFIGSNFVEYGLNISNEYTMSINKNGKIEIYEDGVIVDEIYLKEKNGGDIFNDFNDDDVISFYFGTHETHDPSILVKGESSYIESPIISGIQLNYFKETDELSINVFPFTSRWTSFMAFLSQNRAINLYKRQ